MNRTDRSELYYFIYEELLLPALIYPNISALHIYLNSHVLSFHSPTPQTLEVPISSGMAIRRIGDVPSRAEEMPTTKTMAVDVITDNAAALGHARDLGNPHTKHIPPESFKILCWDDDDEDDQKLQKKNEFEQKKIFNIRCERTFQTASEATIDGVNNTVDRGVAIVVAMVIIVAAEVEAAVRKCTRTMVDTPNSTTTKIVTIDVAGTAIDDAAAGGWSLTQDFVTYVTNLNF